MTVLSDFISIITPLLVLIDPVSSAVVFASLTTSNTVKHRRRLAIKSVLCSGGILFFFMIMGKFFLEQIGISLAALKISGGILLLILGTEMVLTQSSGANTANKEEYEEALEKRDISVFPMAIPIIAGPGCISALIMFMTEAQNDIQRQFIIGGALFTAMAITLLALLIAIPIQKICSVTFLNVMSRILGMLLAALAIQFIIDGVHLAQFF